MVFYVGGNVTDAEGFRSSTPLVRIDPVRHGLLDRQAAPAYDGAAAWGGFEEPQAVFLRRCGLACPERSRQAHGGSFAAVIRSDGPARWPLLFTVGLPHRLDCFLRADRPTQATLALEGRFDGTPIRREQMVSVGGAWTAAALEISLPTACRAELAFAVRLPKDSQILLDDVRFVPVR